MKCLVTGSAGFIGGHLAKRLLEEGHEVEGVDLLEPIRGIGCTTHKIDLLDSHGLKALIAAVEPNVIYHLAARAGVRESLEDPLPYFRTNVEGTASLYEAALEVGVPKIVAASSSSVYGATGRLPMKEDDPCNAPLSPYAASKRAMELVSWTWSEVRGLDVTVLRPFSVYGPYCRPNMVVRKFLKAAADGTEVEIFGDGSASRDFTYVDDVVEALLLAQRHKGWGIFNIAGGRTVSVKELLEMIEQLIGKPVERSYTSSKSGEVPKTFADLELSRTELGYEPRVSMPEGIERTLEWYRSTS